MTTPPNGPKTAAVATVSILGESNASSRPRILLQRRNNRKETEEFRGLWELPKGKIYAGEHLLEAAKREIYSETGLKIARWISPNTTIYFEDFSRSSTRVASFHPYFCSQARGTHPHLALAVLAELRGTPKRTEEAGDHRWFSPAEIIPLIANAQVFPLDVPILLNWISDAYKRGSKSETFRILKLLANTSIMPRPLIYGHPAICFDLGGVLIHHQTPPLYARLAKLFRVTNLEIERLVVGSRLIDPLNVGEVEIGTIRNELEEKTGHAASMPKFIAAWEAGVRIRTENVSTLLRLRNLYPNLQFCALTNLDLIKHQFLIRTASWYVALDYRHVSCLVHDRKPHHSFYLSLLKHIGCAASQIFFIDDKRTNIAGAASMGITTYTARRTQPLGSHFERRVQSWLESQGI